MAGSARFTQTCVDDFRKGRRLLTRRPEWDERIIWAERPGMGSDVRRYMNLFPTVEDVERYMRRNAGKLNACDVETTGEHAMMCQLICVGLASETGDAICIPILSQGGTQYWTPKDLVRIAGLLRWYFAPATRNGAGCRFVYHNGSFDNVVLTTQGIPSFETWAEDTMQALHVADGELPLGLAYLGSRYLELPYWKDDVKGDKRWLELDDVTLRSYNLRDCLVTIRGFPKLLNLLGAGGHGPSYAPGLWEMYREEVALCHVMARATIRGIYMDQKRRRELADKLERQERESLATLRRIAGDPGFNPGSPVQLAEVIFKKLGFPVVKKTEKGNAAIDKEALILLALHATQLDHFTFLTHLVKWRKSSKQLSTWTGRPTLTRMAAMPDGRWTRSPSEIASVHSSWATWASQQPWEWDGGLPLTADGRLHPNWKATPITGRLASSPNAQNWSTSIKKLFCAPEGRILVGTDLNQAELRGMAYQSRDPELLSMYEKGLNVHTINCSMLFEVRNPGCDTNAQTEAYLVEACRKYLGENYMEFPVAPEVRWKSMRTLAKNFVFGDNYGAEAETLYSVIRAKRDPDTDEPLFPDIDLGTIEASKIRWEQLHPAIPRYWQQVMGETQRRGFAQCVLSGRVRFFRGGFKRNEMLNWPTQTLVASHMNKCVLRIDEHLRQACRDAGINTQVHDAVSAECDDTEAERKVVIDIFREAQSQTFSMPGFPEAILPPDAAKAARYLNEV